MTRLMITTLFLVLLALTACEKTEKRSLIERLYEHRVKRCQSMMPKGEESRCTDHPDGTTYKEGGNRVHRVMAGRIARDFPAHGSCTMHAHSFLICQETSAMPMPGDSKMRSRIYKMDAKDDSDTRSIVVWSEEW
jgi:hypothetical protein